MGAFANMEPVTDRSTGLGGTDLAAILGVHPYVTPMEVWARKRGLMDDIEMNDPMYWGLQLEPVIAEEYAFRSGAKLIDLKDVTGGSTAFRHPKNDFMFGSPDRLVPQDRKVLEVKTAGQFQSKNWGHELDGPDGIPEHYVLQVRWYLAFPWFNDGASLPLSADLAVLIGGRDFRCYEIARNEQIESELIETARVFWSNHIVTGIPPEESSDPSDRDILSKHYSEDASDMIVATPEIEKIIGKLVFFKSIGDSAQKMIDECKNAICAFIGCRTGVESQHGTIYWKERPSGKRSFICRFIKERKDHE